jgi:alpha-ribazole phosphatase
MKLIFLRHGETEWNSLKRYQGHTDIPLNDKGREQAQKAAQYLARHEELDAIYCSDLSRTRETAQIVAGKVKLPVQIDARLREASFAIWEGMSFSDVYRHHLQQFNCWYQDIWKYKMPGGENFTEVWERVSLAIQDITRQDYGSVLVVTHGGVVKALLGKIDPSLDIWKTAIDPGSMTIIRYERGVYTIQDTGLVFSGYKALLLFRSFRKFWL